MVGVPWSAVARVARCISFNVSVACAILLATLDAQNFLQLSLDSKQVGRGMAWDAVGQRIASK